MAKGAAPENLYCNFRGNVCFLTWDSVKKTNDNPPVPINIIGYFIYRTFAPNALYFTTPYLAFVETINPYSEVDVHWVDYDAGNSNALYRVCPFDGVEIGDCSISFGISSEGTITIPQSGRWDDVDSKWDESLFG